MWKEGGGILKGKNLLSGGSIFFPLRVAPPSNKVAVVVGGKYFHVRVISPWRYIHSF